MRPLPSRPIPAGHRPFASVWLLPFCLLAVCLPAGCTQVLDAEPPAHVPQLVVNGLFSDTDTLFGADVGWKVEVTASKGLSDAKGYPTVTDATVEVFRDGGRVATLLHVGGGVYRDTAGVPAPGTSELRVTAPSYPPAVVRDELPPPPAVVGIGVDRSRRDADSPLVAAILELTDPPGTEAFYYARTFVWQRGFGSDSVNLYRNYDMRFDLSDPIEVFTVGDRQVFTNRTFAGQTYRFSVSWPYQGGQYVVIEVARVSRAWYEYFRTVDGQINWSENILSEPAPVFNPVVGGYGIFAGYNVRYFMVRDG